MATTSTYTFTQARAKLASIFNEVSENRDIVIISRRNSEDVALIPVSELNGIIETAHLLRSPKNAERLMKALERAESRITKPQTLDEFKKEILKTCEE